MTLNRLRSLVRFCLVAALGAASASAQTVSVNATASIVAKQYVGWFAPTSQLQIAASGVVDLYAPNLLLTNPDGSLAAVYNGPVITWANAGAAYPTFAGGDGINHYPGGGTNWQGTVWSSLGTQSTDTTNPATIRFGTLVGTFKDAPAAADWFVVGLGTTVTTPVSGGRLYLAIVDCPNCQADNTGTYQVTLSGPAAAPFNAADQYSVVANPNGNWAYGFKLAADVPGSFTAFTHSYTGYLDAVDGWDGVSQYSDTLPVISKNRTNASVSDCCTVFLPGELLAHPGATRDAAFRFTAPQSGPYQITGWLRGMALGGTTTTGMLYHGAQQLSSTSLTGYQAISPIPTLVVSLLAGDTIDLIITKGGNGTHTSDSTGVNLLITPTTTGSGDPTPRSIQNLGGAYLRAAAPETIVPQQFTIETWFRGDAPGLGSGDDAFGAALINKPIEGAVGSNIDAWGLYWSSSNGRIAGHVGHFEQSSGTYVQSSAVIPQGALAHCALTFDGATLRLFVNGQLDTSTPTAFSNVLNTPNMPVLIGAANFGVGYTRTFQGLLDEVRIWDHARTAAQIAMDRGCQPTGPQTGLLAGWNFDGASLLDISGNGHNAMGVAPGGTSPAYVAQPAAVGSACRADFNCDGGVAVSDIFSFLTAWFASDPRADFNGAGGIGVSDIFDFLNAWFAGCQ